MLDLNTTRLLPTKQNLEINLCAFEQCYLLLTWIERKIIQIKSQANKLKITQGSASWEHLESHLSAIWCLAKGWKITVLNLSQTVSTLNKLKHVAAVGKVVNAIKFKTWTYWTFCNYTWVISGQYVGHLVASVPFPLIEFLLWLEAMAGSAKQVTCCVFQPYLGHNLEREEAEKGEGRKYLLHKDNKND